MRASNDQRGSGLRRDGRVQRIAIILPRLEMNGVSRVNAILAAGFTAHGCQVDIVTSEPDGTMANEFVSNASICAIGVGSRVRFFPDLIRYLRRYQPTHVISCFDDVNLMLLAARHILRHRFFILVVSHNSIVESRSDHHSHRPLRRMVLGHGVRRCYGKFDAVGAVSDGLAGELCQLTGLARECVTVLPNPVLNGEFRDAMTNTHDGICDNNYSIPLIGFFGRLEPQKNVEMLLHAFTTVRNHISCRLLVVGEGSRSTRLMKLAGDLGIDSVVTFQPFTKHPAELMRSCNLVVLPSRYEGFGNVLVEAMACGVQVVSTDCHYGPSEILQGGKLGQLVPVDDVGKMAEAIERSLRREFWVDAATLVNAAGKYTVESSFTAYLRTLQLT